MKQNLRKKFNISRIAIKYPWLTVSFWIAVTVAGFFAFSSLKYALFPDITFPVIIINAKSDLITAFDTEKQLTNILEKPLENITGLDEINSVTYPGQSVVNILFLPNISLEESEKQVKEKLANLKLPENTTIDVIPYNLNESSVVTYVIQSQTKDIYEIKDITESKIIPTISNIPGVLRVNLLGDKTGEIPTIVNFNGEKSIAFQVIKQGKANTLEVVSRVEKEVLNLQSNLPEIELKLAQTEANYIREATQATIDSLIGAIILAVLIIYPFLRNFYATFITALAIPISLLGTCIVMAIAGFNLETITLLALALVIGIIVDDAIVDVENISRYIEQGKKPKEAAILGTDEIGLTVSASTLTIVAVFLPIAFMGGSIGQFFKPFALTISAAVLISLLVARTLSPVLCMWWLKPNQKSPKKQEIKEFKNYGTLLNWALNNRKIVTIIAILTFVIGLLLIPFIPQGFIPKLDRGEFKVIFTTSLPKISLQKSQEIKPNTDNNSQDNGFNWMNTLAKSPERILLSRGNKIATEIEPLILDIPDVDSIFTILGDRGEVNKGKIYVKLKDNRQLNTAQIQENLRRSLINIKNATISVEDIQFIDTGEQKPLQLVLVGENWQNLTKTAQEIKAKVEKIPGFVDVSATEIDNNKIEHRYGKRVAYITANLAENQALGNAMKTIVNTAKTILPPDISLDFKGDSDLVGGIFRSFSVTLFFSVTFMLFFLILPFGRLLEPMVVGLSLPLAMVGAFFALLITGSDFGMISLVALIFLLGLLDKNAILLMDYTNQLRRMGMQRHQAIVTSGMTRLRPILMTTFSTILGMLPIALGLGAGAELRQPMAVAIIGGLISSSLLSLIVVPVFYTLWEDFFIVKKS